MDAEALLADLTAEQRHAATTLRGPVRILAGAGTGKTRTITRRIAYGLATGTYSPGRVMALTFTTKAAGELRERLRQLDSPEVSARTFHSAALAQLSHFWPMVIGGPLPEVLESKGRFLAEAAERLGIASDPIVLRDVASEIEWRKVNGVSIDQYADLGRPVPSALTPGQLIDVMAAYEAVKDARRRLDFEDVLLATAGLLEDEPWALDQVREQYRVFVVDEYQDVSPLQQRLLDLWVGTRRDVCVVGDASQTIYSFAGASATPLLQFARRYQDATLVSLDLSHRSVPGILQGANALIQGEPGAVMLQPVRPKEQIAIPARPPVRIAGYRTASQEAAAVAEAIANEIAAGIAPDHIAVLYRVHALSAALETALQQFGIPFQVQGQQRFFTQPQVKRALEQVRAQALADPDGDPYTATTTILRGLGWSTEAPGGGAAERTSWESLQAIADQAEAASAEQQTLRQFATQLQARQAANAAPGRKAVHLSTIHAAKGLEWRSVHVVGVAEGLLPIDMARSDAELAEERRLLYVAMTRAQDHLSLTWSAQAMGRGTRSPSRFLDQIPVTPEQA